MKITMGGNEVTLIGNEVKVGDKAPLFKALDKDLKEVNFKDFIGKTVILTSFPSIDTGICSLQTIKFNNEVSKFGKDVVLITISNDLPFAISRYCAVNGIENAITLSDYRDLEFANSYGMLIKELRLLGRSVFIIDKEGIIKHIDICEEIKTEVNYEKALEVLKAVL